MTEWHGGRVRHIVQGKVILLERGQVFEIEGKRIFTFGGASSHDIEGGILDRQDPMFAEKRKYCKKYGKRYRILHETWWEEELPTEEEMQEGLHNLKKVGFCVDYVITHCMSNRMQKQLEQYYVVKGMEKRDLPEDRLTDYFDRLEDRLNFGHWYCGHYHCNAELDERHSILYRSVQAL
ncbi:MAG: hypothetical protein IJF07_08995 [Lachnospiraceae bacterium]|nr:hypothetical protein [Lachnospiraceae bacterium]